MSDAGYTAADLELFTDLERAASAAQVVLCLMGAGAIKLGARLHWGVRLARETLDWDFAVRVDSWEHYEALSAHLVTEGRAFERAREPHRFQHRSGGLLDLVPYGVLERPPGTIEWSDGTAMDTTGMCVLDVHHENLELGPLRLRSATLPAIVGLKLLAYRARCPGITRDIADVHDILRDIEDTVLDDRVVTEGLGRLNSGEVGYGEIGAYLLGRDVGRAFLPEARAPMCALLDEALRPEAPTISVVLRSSSGVGLSRELVADRLQALQLGIIDR